MPRSNTTRIKICVKKRNPPISMDYNPSIDKLENSNNFESLELLKICRHHKICVRGNKSHLCSLLLKKIHNISPKNNPEQIIGKVFITYFLFKIGNCNLVDQCKNSDDFYTTTDLNDIPKIFLYCTKSNPTYGFDIRSLDALMSSSTLFRNPYTDKTFDNEDLEYMKKKIRWITRLGFYQKPTRSRKLTADIHQYTINIFSHINHHQYVDYNCFLNLSFDGLQSLYRELYEIWNFRLPMQNDYKLEMVQGQVFANWDSVKLYKSSMESKLRFELLRNIEKLVTDGQTEDHCKAGCYIFMLGLVLVSESAATSNPSLYQAAYYAEN